MARVGYARVSSVGQSLEVQLDKLKHCDKIYQEKKSGVSGRRPRLQACLEYLREGDTLVVTRLDRLARSTLHLCQIATDLERKQVNLQGSPDARYGNVIRKQAIRSGRKEFCRTKVKQ